MTAESTISDPYDAVLADLLAKRDQIDQIIQGIEAIRAGGSNSGVGGNAPAANPVDPPPGATGWLLGLTIPDAAKKVLASRRQAMRNPEVWEAFKAAGYHMNSADPVNTIGSVLTRRFNEVGDIVKVGRGTWGLKEWYTGRNFKKDKGDAEEKAEVPAPKPSAAA